MPFSWERADCPFHWLFSLCCEGNLFIYFQEGVFLNHVRDYLELHSCQEKAFTSFPSKRCCGCSSLLTPWIPTQQCLFSAPPHRHTHAHTHPSPKIQSCLWLPWLQREFINPVGLFISENYHQDYFRGQRGWWNGEELGAIHGTDEGFGRMEVCVGGWGTENKHPSPQWNRWWPFHLPRTVAIRRQVGMRFEVTEFGTSYKVKMREERKNTGSWAWHAGKLQLCSCLYDLMPCGALNGERGKVEGVCTTLWDSFGFFTLNYITGLVSLSD